MTEVVESHERRSLPEIHHQVEQFYAWQMRALDDGDAAAWAATFTEDGVFTSDGTQDQASGRAQLEAGAAHAISRLTASGVTRRHLVSNIRVERVRDDMVRASSYVPVIDTIDGQARITTSTVVHDELVRSGATWLVSHRTVLRDDISSP